MCMMDLWIYRHTLTRSQTGATSYTVVPDPNRLRLIVGYAQQVTVTTASGRIIYAYSQNTVPYSYTGTITTQVPPGTDTITLGGGGSGAPYICHVLRIEDFGTDLLAGLTVGVNNTGASVVEVLADTVLAQKLADLDRLEGWPLFGSPR